MGRTRAVSGLALLGVIVAVLVIALVIAGGASRRRASDPFAWLRPAEPPGGWRVARTPDGATIAYPPAWTPINTDAGTVSVALRGRGGTIDDYLNVTPRQGAETLANWSRFRPEKNRAEGSRDVQLLAATNHARFRSADGACVLDAYTTSITRYEEIACLVAGPKSSDVVVAAAPIRLWSSRSPVLERAVADFVV